MLNHQKKIKTFPKEFSKNPPEEAESRMASDQKTDTTLKNQLFMTLSFNPKSFIHSEGRNKHCLFSALMRNVAVAHPTFLIEAEKRQSAYFCLQNEQIILGRPNFGVKGKDVHPKKSVFQSGVSFLIPCILGHGQCPLVDF